MHFSFHFFLLVLKPWDVVQSIGERKWRTVGEQLPFLHAWKPVVQKMPPERHSLAIQSSLLEEGSLSLGIPAQPTFGWSLCDFCL